MEAQPVSAGKVQGNQVAAVSPEKPSTFQRAKDSVQAGVGGGINSIVSAAKGASEWQTVKTVRNSTVWNWITWPFSAISSLFSGIWSRISRVIWGSPTTVLKEVTLDFPGYLWTTTVTTDTERAIRKGWLTIEKGIADKVFTLDDAQINGWVPVTIPGRFYNSTMMLKTAVEGGYMTVEQAIDAGHITQEQALKADWLKKN